MKKQLTPVAILLSLFLCNGCLSQSGPFSPSVAPYPPSAVQAAAIQAAKYAVQDTIRSRFGAGYRVAFEQPTVKIISVPERLVSGTAHLANANSWDFERTFTYSVKARLDGSNTRDLAIVFSDGKKFNGASTWQPANPASDYVHLTRPRWYERLDSSQVVFEGECRDLLNILVFDSLNRKVGEANLRPRDGRFRASLELPTGQMRALLKSAGASHPEEVRFSVNSTSHDWGHPVLFTVEQPPREASLNTSSVTFAGSSSERFVRLQVWDTWNTRVADRQVPTKAGSWNTQISLKDGGYSFTAESGHERETRRFQVVRSVSQKPGKPVNGPILGVQVNDPKRDALTKGPRVTLAGNSPERYVRIQLWDSRNKPVAERQVPTRNNYWNTQIPLAPGKYRLRADVPSGRDYEEFWFSVR
jgi:hypothetical protein